MMIHKLKKVPSIKRKGIALVIAVVLSLLLPVNAQAVPENYRISGQDRFKTARYISEYFKAGTVQDVIITSGHNFADALSASVWANKINAPILLAEKNSQETKEALGYISQRLSKSGTVHIIGGKSIVNADMEAQLKQLGYDNVERIQGKNRYETSALVAQKANVAKNTPVVIVSGENFPDALSISSIASHKGWPILLASENYMSQEIKDYISKGQPSEVYIVGGTGTVSDTLKGQIQTLVPNSPVTRIAGHDRFDTNAKIIETFIQEPKKLYLATGYNFADALSGSVLAASTGDPIILVDPKASGLPSGIASYIATTGELKGDMQIIALGGQAAVSDSQINSARSIVDSLKDNLKNDSLKIVDIETVNANTTVGTAPVLPATVKVLLSDSTSRVENVIWESVSDSKYAVPGTFTVKGTIGNVNNVTKANSNIMAIANVTVEAVHSSLKIVDIGSVSVRTTVGTAPVLPTEVRVFLSDSTAHLGNVVWESIPASKYAAPGTFTVKGSIENVNKIPKANANVTAVANVTVEAETSSFVLKIREITPVMVNTAVGVAPVLPTEVPVITNESSGFYTDVVWDTIPESKYIVPGTFVVKGTLANLDIPTANPSVVPTATIVVGEVDPNIKIFNIFGSAHSINTRVNHEPVLPATVWVNLTNGMYHAVNVVWEDIPEEKCAVPGIFTVKGTIETEYEIETDAPGRAPLSKTITVNVYVND